MRLLDLTNSNRLLNYKFSARSRRQVRLVDELPDELIERLESEKRLTFRSLPEPGDAPQDEMTEAFVSALEQAKRSDEYYLAALKQLGDDEDVEALRRIETALRKRLRKTLGMPDRRARDEIKASEWARANGIDPTFELPLPSKRAGNSSTTHTDAFIQTLLFPDEMERTLSTITDQARSALQETGINTLYIALGFLEWYETTSSQTPLYAPLLLHPIDIMRKIVGGKYRYSIGSLGDETQINITLSERLERDFHRRLPVFEEDDTPETYFHKVQTTIADLPRWRVRRFVVVGHFAFARLVMFHDLEDARWADGHGIVRNPVVAELLAGHGTAADAFFAEEYHIDDPIVAAKVPLLITDADSSQFSAIVDVMDGKNLAIKGPPGTGKSQTIANMIAAALSSAKTVLFVAEKMAALNVVKDRLEKFGLGHFCLELHSTKARKKDLLESLKKRLAIQGHLQSKGDLKPVLKELQRTREQLNTYVSAINRPFGSSGRTIQEILWIEQKTRDYRHELPEAIQLVEIADSKKITQHDLSSLNSNLEVLATSYSDVVRGIGMPDRHPWFGVCNSALDYFTREQLINRLRSIINNIDNLTGVLRALCDVLRCALPETISGASSLSNAGARLPARSPSVDSILLTALKTVTAFQVLDNFQRSQAAWLDTQRRLKESTDARDVAAERTKELRELTILAAAIDLNGKTIGALATESLALSAHADKIARVLAFGRIVSDAFQIDSQTKVGALTSLLAGAALAAALPWDLRHFRQASLRHRAASTLLAEADVRAKTLNNRMTQLATRIQFTLDSDARKFRGHADALRSANFLSSFWRRDVRVAKLRHSEMLRAPGRASRIAIADDFDALAECIETSSQLASDTSLNDVCGSHFRGHLTPFAELHTVSLFMSNVTKFFASSDNLDEKIGHVLLEGTAENLESVAQLTRHPDAAIATQLLKSIRDPDRDLQELYGRIDERAAAVAKLSRRAQAIGLPQELETADISRAADEAEKILATATANVSSIEVELANIENAIEANAEARLLLSTSWRGPRTDRTIVIDALSSAAKIERASLPPPVRDYLYHPDHNARIGRLTSLSQSLKDALDALRQGWSDVSALGGINEKEFFGTSIDDASMVSVKERVARALEEPDRLVVWTTWLAARKDCVANGLTGILQSFDGRPFESILLTRALDRAYWRTLARDAFAEFPEIGLYRGLQLEKARQRFSQLDEEIIRRQRDALAFELSQRRIDPGYQGVYRKEDTGLVLLHNEVGKKKRHIPIRELLARAGLSISQMKPCFMMSPLSVAQFLKPSGLKFDLVVIDEASQMRPEEALGAIARGGQAVVVGDPMQLPPTSFFDRVDRVIDDEIDEEEIVDNESILDLALAEFRPARTLRWHYRSRHESLTGISVLTLHLQLLYRSGGLPLQGPASFGPRSFRRRRERPVSRLALTQHREVPFFQSILPTLLPPPQRPHRNRPRSALYLSGCRGQHRDPLQHAAKEPSRQMTLREKQPVVAGVLDQAAAGFHQALL
jgi:hypothetical protein